MVGDALLDIIFAPEENDGVGMLIGKLNSNPHVRWSLGHIIPETGPPCS